METTDEKRSRIFNRLDDLFSKPVANREAQGDGEALGTAKSVSGDTTEKDYKSLMATENASSNSKLGLLHNCPKSYQLAMYRAASQLVSPDVEAVFGDNEQKNIHFAYGHAVGAGIQTYASTGNLVAAQFAAFVAWKADYAAVDPKKKEKSLTSALHAIEVFARFWEENLEEWEVLVLPNGTAASELSFAVDMENGRYHYGHIDLVLQHRTDKRLAVWEGKTAGAASIDPASYGNSWQALGYSVVVDALGELLQLPTSSYEVFYVVYSVAERQFTLLPFTKTRQQRAEWLQDLLIIHASLGQYKALDFYPRRGEGCINRFRQQCEWYGSCQIPVTALFPKVELKQQEGLEGGKKVQYSATLSQLIEAQRARDRG